MKLMLTKDFGTHLKGRIIDPSPGSADIIMRRGFAVPLELYLKSESEAKKEATKKDQSKKEKANAS